MICFCPIVSCPGSQVELARDTRQNTIIQVFTGNTQRVPVNTTAMLRCLSRHEHSRHTGYFVTNSATTRCLITGVWSLPFHHFDCFKGKCTLLYRSGTVNSNMVNSKFHLIRSYCEIFLYHFPNISCLKCTVNSNFHLI